MRSILLSLFILTTSLCFAQESPDSCFDYVYLKNGSIYRGSITEFGDEGRIKMKTWNGHELAFNGKVVKKVVQRCKGQNAGFKMKPYDFRERGWYHHTRVGTLCGMHYQDWVSIGFGIQHSSGYQLNRLLGIGVGLGAERFMVGDNDANTYPLFAEARGYLLPQRITPYFEAGLGWAFAQRTGSERWGYTDQYSGGLMAQAKLGYRFGNHMTASLGLRFQQKERTWESINDGSFGTDKILHQRIEVGVGMVF